MARDVSALAHIPLTSDLTALSQSSSLRVDYVRLTWVDYANNPRCRILPWAYYSNLISKNARPGVRIAKVVLGYVGARVAEGFKPVGNWLLVVDTNSLRAFPTEKNVAMVFGWFQEVNPNPNERIGSLLCPRYVLHRTLQCVLIYSHPIGRDRKLVLIFAFYFFTPLLYN